MAFQRMGGHVIKHLQHVGNVGSAKVKVMFKFVINFIVIK